MQLPGEEPISATDFFGHERSLNAAILSKLAGLNIKGAALRDLQQVKTIELRRQIEELSSQLVRAQRSGITDPQKQAATERIADRLRTVMEKARQEIVFQPEGQPAQSGRLLETRKDFKPLSQSSAKTIGDSVRRDLRDTMKDETIPLEQKIQRSLQQKPVREFLENFSK